MTDNDLGAIAQQVWFAANRLRSARERKGWTQQEAALVLDIKRETICYLETGKQRITLPLLLRFSIVYETTVAELLALDQWES